MPAAVPLHHVVRLVRQDTIGGNVIFSIADNPGDANFTFTLKDNIDHDNDGNLATGTNDSLVCTLMRGSRAA